MPSINEIIAKLPGRNVLVMGLGRHGGGVAVTRWLAEQGAAVTVTDLASPQALSPSVAQLADLPICWRLGGHDVVDFDRADLLIVNPAVKLDHPLVKRVQARGGAISSEVELFLRHNRGTVVAVTGTVGKTTTASMLAKIAQHAGKRVFLGGNIGRSLLPDLHNIAGTDLVVLELSSFQLAWLNSDVPRPDLAIITNCSPHHLDWHGSWDAYRQAKQRLLRGQLAAKKVVVSITCDEVASWTAAATSEIVPAGDVAHHRLAALPNEPFRTDALLAIAAAALLHIDEDSVFKALNEFKPLPHRLEAIGHVGGRKLINDSKATSAAATLAALAAVQQPAWLLAGGVFQGQSLQFLARAIVAQTTGAVFFGQCAAELAAACRALNPNYRAFVAETLTEAFQRTYQASEIGDTILLSPACVSHDQFDDFAQRGDAFCEIARQLAAKFGGEICREQSLQ